MQWARLAAVDYDRRAFVADYRRKRDLLADGLRGHYEFELPGGAFYLFPKAPWGTGTEFVTEAIEHNLLIIPGSVFSRRDTHFRISYAATATRTLANAAASTSCCKRVLARKPVSRGSSNR